jgi:hypothetical protein
VEGTWVRLTAPPGRTGRWHSVRRLFPGGELAMYCGTVARRERVTVTVAALVDVSGRVCASCRTLGARADASRGSASPVAVAEVTPTEEWIRYGSRQARGQPGPWHRVEMREGRTLRMWCGFSSASTVLVETRRAPPAESTEACSRCLAVG